MSSTIRAVVWHKLEYAGKPLIAKKKNVLFVIFNTCSEQGKHILTFILH